MRILVQVECNNNFLIAQHKNHFCFNQLNIFFSSFKANYRPEKRLQQYEILWKWAVLFNSIDKKGLIEEYLRTILEPWRSTQEAEGVALEMR